MTNNLSADDQPQRGATKADGVAQPCTVVLFGASGDLTQRMIMPSIFRLARRGLLSPQFRVIGYARSKLTDDEFRERMRQAVMRDARAGDEQAWPAFAAQLSYLSAAYDGDDVHGYAELARKFEQAEREAG
ncbi:MAG: glucose-6-phosphate dehydrogenase, partial [Acidobacteriota bacterium]